MRRLPSLLAAVVAAVVLVGGGQAVRAMADDTPAAAGPVGPVARHPGLEGGPSGAGAACKGPASVCTGEQLFGLATGDADRMGPVFTGLERDLGVRAGLVESYQDFTSYFDVPELTKVVRDGRTPVVTWEPVRSTSPTKDSFPLSAIAAGRFDTYLRSRAAQVARVPGEVIIRFGHEMNGFWYPWGQPRALHPNSVANPSNTPAKYVAAYRHVWSVFARAGVTNVTWMWSPNVVDANSAVTLSSLYPGDRYVDVLGLSGYFPSPGSTFEGRFRETMGVLEALAPDKSLIVAETGVVAGAARPAQLADLLAGLYDLPQVVGVIYFSVPDTAIDYRLQGDAAALAAARQALAAQRVGQAYGDELALVAAPVVLGNPIVGETVSAGLSWRGTATSSTVRWWSCPSATLEESCRVAGGGDEHRVGLADRGRFLFVTMGAVSPAGVDTGTSFPIGPVRVNPPEVPVAGIDLLSDAVRIRFGTAAEGLTHWLVSLDDPTMASPTYLPVATTEHYFNGLAPGSTHTVTVSSCDCPTKGAATSYTFGVVTKPPAAQVAVGSDGAATVTLPAAVGAQTGWALRVDGGEPFVLPAATAQHLLADLAPGPHTVALARIAGDGRTSSTATGFTVPQASG